MRQDLLNLEASKSLWRENHLVDGRLINPTQTTLPTTHNIKDRHQRTTNYNLFSSSMIECFNLNNFAFDNFIIIFFQFIVIFCLVFKLLHTFLILPLYDLLSMWRVLWYGMYILYFCIIWWQILYPLGLLNLIWIRWLYNEWMNPSSMIGFLSPGNWATANPYVRLQGHWDRQIKRVCRTYVRKISKKKID